MDREMYRMHCGMAFANLFAGRFDEASSWAEKALNASPNFLAVVAVVAASNALAGRLQEAQKAAARLGELDPTLRVSSVGDWLPYRGERLALFEEGLRRAGMPE
jgi:hypothetical protein